MIEVKHERQIVLGVIFRTQVALFERAVRARALARIVNPAYEVIVIVFFADAAQVRGKGAADHVRAFADGVAGQAAARFKQNLAVRGVAGRLLVEGRAGQARTAR